MKKIFYFLFFIVAHLTNCAQEKIRLYTFYTPSHAVLLEQWFLPSIQDDFELVVIRHEQECPSGVYKTDGWGKSMLRKVDLIIQAIQDNWDEVFVYSDIDIQFFRSFKGMIPELLKDNDMVIQRDNPLGQACAGFLICKGNERTLRLWHLVRSKVILDAKRGDQDILNGIIRGPDNCITWDYLPDVFFGAGTYTGKQWKPGMFLKIPQNIILHHANWTGGVSNKIAQLVYVKNKVYKK